MSKKQRRLRASAGKSAVDRCMCRKQHLSSPRSRDLMHDRMVAQEMIFKGHEAKVSTRPCGVEGARAAQSTRSSMARICTVGNSGRADALLANTLAGSLHYVPAQETTKPSLWGFATNSGQQHPLATLCQTAQCRHLAAGAESTTPSTGWWAPWLVYHTFCITCATHA